MEVLLELLTSVVFPTLNFGAGSSLHCTSLTTVGTTQILSLLGVIDEVVEAGSSGVDLKNQLIRRFDEREAQQFRLFVMNPIDPNGLRGRSEPTHETRGMTARIRTRARARLSKRRRCANYIPTV